MKIANRYQILSLFILALSMATNSMDKKPKKKKNYVPKWVLTAGEAILGKRKPGAIEQEVSFGQLPSDTRLIIFDSLLTTIDAQSLKQVAKALQKLSVVSKELNALFNDQSFCFSMIKRYAMLFKTNDTMICSMLPTSGTKTILNLQNRLIREICENGDPDKLIFNELVKSGADLYFTDLNDDTPAEICIRNYNTDGLKMLLDSGIDPEFIGKNKVSLYDLATSRSNKEFASGMIKLLKNAISEKYANQ